MTRNGDRTAPVRVRPPKDARQRAAPTTVLDVAARVGAASAGVAIGRARAAARRLMVDEAALRPGSTSEATAPDRRRPEAMRVRVTPAPGVGAAPRARRAPPAVPVPVPIAAPVRPGPPFVVIAPIATVPPASASPARRATTGGRPAGRVPGRSIGMLGPAALAAPAARAAASPADRHVTTAAHDARVVAAGSSVPPPARPDVTRSVARLSAK